MTGVITAEIITTGGYYNGYKHDGEKKTGVSTMEICTAKKT
jgi:hypothetical protein